MGDMIDVVCDVVVIFWVVIVIFVLYVYFILELFIFFFEYYMVFNGVVFGIVSYLSFMYFF